MATPRINWYSGACYHITSRGNHRNDIFKDEEDFQVYLTLIYESLEYYMYEEYKVICYCLMDNHVHILISTNNSPPGKFVRRLNSKYAKYFNKKYNYIGHLFQDKYHHELIENDAQMLDTSRYIHLNPVKAKMVVKPEEYKWSSYNMYIGIKAEKNIHSDMILKYFAKERNRDLYRSFVEAKIIREIGDA
ncbi:transposase [Clostridium oryzae]|uniref:Transposase IS200 like protein n=1 Tax=Clostridium oryzae TaxID=1450648 RepID=A0A1V4IYQ8_9CLOT|nr:transposase [Clostridium oryzae]OPJ65076.1 transposase IS200 like protein [Clostridium oryzae]